MEKIVLFGTGQIAQVVLHYINKDKAFDVCAFCMDQSYINEDTFSGKPVVPFDHIEDLYPPDTYKMAVPMGYKHLNKFREQKYLEAKAKGYELVSFISKDACCETDDIGDNVFILGTVNIQPFTKIGNNVFMWPATAIGHHVVVEDHCFFARPKISGATKIGHHSFLGTNATIGDTLEIGAFCIIGAGANVTKSVPDECVLAVKQTAKLPLKSTEMEDILG